MGPRRPWRTAEALDTLFGARPLLVVSYGRFLYAKGGYACEWREKQMVAVVIIGLHHIYDLGHAERLVAWRRRACWELYARGLWH